MEQKEPIPVYLDKPTVFNKMYDLIVNNLYYNVETMGKIMGIPVDVLDEIFARPKIVKLKIT